MISMNQVKSGLTRYLDAEFAPKLPRGDLRQNLKAGAALAWCMYAISHLETLLPEYAKKAGLDKLGAMDDAGNLDIDGLAAALKPQIGDAGISAELPVVGELTVYPADLDLLVRYIKEG